MAPLPSVGEVQEAFDRQAWSEIGERVRALQKDRDPEVLALAFVSAFPSIRRWQGRVFLLSEVIRFARTQTQVVELALQALGDRSGEVRRGACQVLAYSLRSDVLPALQAHADHPHPPTRDSVQAAIDAIEHQNHHYYFDREHTGELKWWVGPPNEEDRGPSTRQATVDPKAN